MSKRASADAIMAGQPFEYAVVGYGATAGEALAWAQRWQRINGSDGPGNLIYGRTVPVAWGTPERVSYSRDQWRVPVQWAVATHAQAVYA